ncbi:two component transcriptional regulator, LytTR family [Chitinophaga jiangningensis]|uniref:Two component transcriptional regulator, LytTR family n=1 Tax=Chitinophaga jiangningensis TaxID=1419482 RepID=A0A1M7DJZ7_9BACT|nr:LytTR family DNA-binding domain-containing protein [Chitinophaga jiangningensis]SHL79841.1 two component transcriptional regulator, LytTR family [Chitinophaga jiangningensis]
MLNCLIVDDEPLVRKQIESYVEQIPFLHLVGTTRNPVVAQAILSTEVVDLIFLDIKMPQMSGIEFLQTQDIYQQVIFITAYPEYALQGYELDVTDYLMKPVTFERFLKACEKANAKITGVASVKMNREQPDSLFVRSNHRLEKILLADILFIEAMLNYVQIVTRNKKYIVYATLKSIEESLPAIDFLRIHKSFIVALNQITTLEPSQVRVAEYILPTSRRSQQLLKQRFNEIHQRNINK